MKQDNKNKFVRGNIKDYSSTRGYLIGQFMRQKGFPIQETEEVEVAWKKLSNKDKYKKGHYHKIGIEINIVIAGGCSMEVNEEKVNLQKGDFLIVYPESVLRNFKPEDNTEMIIVKAPSVPNDKYNSE